LAADASRARIFSSPKISLPIDSLDMGPLHKPLGDGCQWENQGRESPAFALFR
jgi:hypothetical protein